jgi:hypothetical protein
MSKCGNCGATLTCGCQKRTVNGVSGCSNCVSKLKNTSPAKPLNRTIPAQPTTERPVKSVWGKDRYSYFKNLEKK